MDSSHLATRRADQASQRTAIARLASLLGRLKDKAKGRDDDDDDLPRPNATVPMQVTRLRFATLAFA
ncbi:MAG: hypothetical protein HOW73_05175 [Polyangiaceae bacterium]|nr:hypothetical protein [Polyangiaceae bacterium]